MVLVHGGSGSTDSNNGITLADAPSTAGMPANRGGACGSPLVGTQYGGHNGSGAGPRPVLSLPTSGAPAAPATHLVVDLPCWTRAGQTPRYMGMEQHSSITTSLQTPIARETLGSTPPWMPATVRPHVTPDTPKTAALASPNGQGKEDNAGFLLAFSKGPVRG